jgi:peptidoglycan/xylan/chitin deacetylase (PgdA/CDA1 family)
LSDLSRHLESVRDGVRLLQAFFLRWRGRISSTRAGVAIVYHRVGGEGGDPAVEILPAVSSSAFAAQLRHLRRSYRVVPASELLEAVARRRRWQRFPISITFDDDLASHVRGALPALRQANLTATFFLGGAALQEPHSFWWEDLQRAVDGRLVAPDGVPHVHEAEVRAVLERSPRAILDLAGAIVRLEPRKKAEVAAALREAAGPPAADSGLRAPDVRAIVDAGCTVGFHTLRHAALPSLSDSELEEALTEGRDALAAAAGRRPELIAYPHGKADRRVADAAHAAGFALGFTTARGPVTPDTDPLLIPRTVADQSASDLRLRLARAFALRH